MRLNEQRNVMADAIDTAGVSLLGLRARVLRKMAAPYGDGTRSNMVNAETDVLPIIERIVSDLADEMRRINPAFEFGAAVVPCTRIW